MSVTPMRDSRRRESPPADTFPLSEAGDSEHFAERERDRMVYDHARRRWFAYDAHRWREDGTGQATQRALEAMRARQAAALTVADSDERARRIRWCVAGESESRLRHLLELAATHPALAVTGDEWDRDPMALGVANGVLDLATGALRPGTPADRITRAAAVPYDAAAPCDRWTSFINEICDDDAELAGFLGRALGYAVTGSTSEQVFFLLHGSGANGKSTLLETLTRCVLPEHSWTMPFPTTAWTESLSEYQRAQLLGRRLVVAKESEAAKRLNSEFLKSLTGTETVNARHPYGRPFTFLPAAKVMLACNHRPVIRDESHGMWRRVRLVPFTRTFAVDPALPEQLAAEAPGILRWLVAQSLAWQRHGLGLPASVAQATDEYQRASDPLAAFVAERCVVADHATVRAGTVWQAYRAWCDQQQVPDADRLSLRAFGDAMKRKHRAIEGRVTTYTGLGLRDDREQEAP